MTGLQRLNSNAPGLAGGIVPVTPPQHAVCVGTYGHTFNAYAGLTFQVALFNTSTAVFPSASSSYLSVGLAGYYLVWFDITVGHSSGSSDAAATFFVEYSSNASSWFELSGSRAYVSIHGAGGYATCSKRIPFITNGIVPMYLRVAGAKTLSADTLTTIGGSTNFGIQTIHLQEVA